MDSDKKKRKCVHSESNKKDLEDEEKKIPSLYQQFHVSKGMERKGLFSCLLKEKLCSSSSSLLYLGCGAHLTPSLFFEHVCFVDNWKKSKNFYTEEDVLQYVVKNKVYKGKPKMVFHFSDYTKDFGEEHESFDVLLSQFAGFVSCAGKKFLKPGGILVANDSHADASMAYLDKQHFELIAVYNEESDDLCRIERSDLDKYFKGSKEQISVKMLEKTGKGPKYSKQASGYIFRKK